MEKKTIYPSFYLILCSNLIIVFLFFVFSFLVDKVIVILPSWLEANEKKAKDIHFSLFPRGNVFDLLLPSHLPS